LNGRGKPAAAEQQDRLVEHLGPQRGHLASATHLPHPLGDGAARRRELTPASPARILPRRCSGEAQASSEPRLGRCPGHQLARLTPWQDRYRAMSQQPRQIQQALSQTDPPRPDREARYPPLDRSLHGALAVLNGGHRTQDGLGAIHLPGQRVAGQDPLPALAFGALRQPHPELLEAVRSAQLPQNALGRELELLAAAPTAAAACQDRVRLPRLVLCKGAGQQRLVLARMNPEAVRHCPPRRLRKACEALFRGRRHFIRRTNPSASPPTVGDGVDLRQLSRE
jgi:hypothetical protein